MKPAFLEQRQLLEVPALIHFTGENVRPREALFEEPRGPEGIFGPGLRVREKNVGLWRKMKASTRVRTSPG